MMPFSVFFLVKKGKINDQSSGIFWHYGHLLIQPQPHSSLHWIPTPCLLIDSFAVCLVKIDLYTATNLAVFWQFQPILKVGMIKIVKDTYQRLLIFIILMTVMVVVCLDLVNNFCIWILVPLPTSVLKGFPTLVYTC